ncbi:TetR/AcrR family transcriptional regulator [Pseudanabaena sp. UWO311]|uniref:TetR/AcrR family transcriptional regulator n=1 Tax=Pseudanabaena sp. UWO311 TaxID=2487337 RepID=UPI0016803979|nr:TetR/AcrR family transcriptional regulator [Pseudanabaena sp. UWO311]
MKGRPREFDLDRALDSAMLVFWRDGYEGASLSELTAAMNINRPSLYGTFGDKESLFFKVLDRYIECYAKDGVGKLSEYKDIGEAIAAFFASVEKLLTDPHHPAGCLIANCTLECGRNRYEAISRRLNQCHAETTAALYQRLRLAQIEGQLAADEDVQAMAQFFTATMMGMGMMARTGANLVAIRQVSALALRLLKKNSQVSS